MQGFAQPDARRHRCAGAHRARGGGAALGAGGGDHRDPRAATPALIAADDPVALAQTARHLMDDVYQAPGQPRLRIALHYGEVQTRPARHRPAPEIVGGDAILCAARVEPIVEPGQIWATEAFREQFLQRPSLWRTTPLAAPGGDGTLQHQEAGLGRARRLGPALSPGELSPALAGAEGPAPERAVAR